MLNPEVVGCQIELEGEEMGLLSIKGRDGDLGKIGDRVMTNPHNFAFQS